MSIVTLLLIALALAMDCFALSISIGLSGQKASSKDFVVLALMFGLFQAVMPLVGWVCCSFFGNETVSWTKYIAGALLFFVGSKMIYETLSQSKEVEKGEKSYDLKFSVVVALSIATSLDALAIGCSFGLMRYDNIFVSVLVIGVVSTLMSFAGNMLGKTIGTRLGSKSEVIGGLILILLAIKTIM